MCWFSRPRALAMGRAAPECSEWVTASKQRDKGCTRHVTARARERGSAGVVLVMALCECLRVRVHILPLFAEAFLFGPVSCADDWISSSCGNHNTRQRQRQKHARCHDLGVCAANQSYVRMPCICVRVPPPYLLLVCACPSRQRALHLPTHALRV